jgi:hypothetical protein
MGSKQRSQKLWESRRAEIEDMYIRLGCSQQQIATRFGAAQPTISEVLRRLNIPLRDHNKRGLRSKYRELDIVVKSIGTITPSKTRWCNRCGQEKPISEFYLTLKGRGKIQPRCKECDHQVSHTFAVSMRGRSIRHAHNIQKYKLTPEEYSDLLNSQGGVCKVCGTKPKVEHLCVDHDHITGAVRGLLCNGCNAALGCAKDDPMILRGLADYLEWQWPKAVAS